MLARVVVVAAVGLGALSLGQERMTERQRAIHVLNRFAFGPRPGEVDRVMSKGVDRWLAEQLNPHDVRDPVTVSVLEHFRSLSQSPSELFEMAPPPNVLRRALGNNATREDSVELRRAAMQSRSQSGELLAARVARAVLTERQLEEVMVDFWLNHFSVFIGKNPLQRYYLPQFEAEAIRPHALGKFRTLLGAVATSPAMLNYLDNAQSVADSGRRTLGNRAIAERRFRRFMNSPRLGQEQRATLTELQARRPRGLNENYARELLELHTLGVDGGYTQQDVIEVARALTGWTVRPPRTRGGGEFVFNPVAHDAEPKVVLGHRLGANRGQEDGEQVLDIVSRHPATARHIARKLAVRFVADNPSDELVERLAKEFQRNDGDVRATLRVLISSAEFNAPAAFRSKVKSPFETVVSAIRALGGGADSTPFTSQVIARLGQPLYGHQAPDGYPETGAEWMNTGAILNRINFGMMVASDRLPNVRVRSWEPYSALEASSRPAQVAGVIDGVLAGVASPETRAILESGTNPLATGGVDFMSGAGSDSVTMDGDGRSRPGGPPRLQDTLRQFRRPNQNRARGGNFPQRGPGSANVNPTGLAQLIGLALGAPEFQRR